ncbi:MAG: VWA domain-containing protein [Candidatus Rokubacteria bacterium]|nr:VWA domain-containing protein [Candidatus Rokubacteria bacterium]
MLTTALIEFTHRLRDAAVPVSMVEALDAVEALRHIDLSDRRQFKVALGATLVKRAEHRAAFETLFDIYFAPRRAEAPGAGAGPARPAAPGPSAPGDAAGGEGPSEGFLRALLDALQRDDEDALQALAAVAVQRFAGMRAQGGGSTAYFLYRVLRQLDLSTLFQRAIREAREASEEETELDARLLREEQGRRIEAFRRLIAAEIRRRLVELKGPDAAAAYLRTPIEEVDFLAASPAQLRAMREAIRPLAHKLAVRIAHRRRIRRRGRLDMRKTIRRSLSAGGVPLEPAFRYPRASRPDLYLLCDVSGSVAEFAEFTMSLLYAMNEELPRIRSFAFVDGIDEVTRVFADRSTLLDASRLLARARVVAADGHSDYGQVFTRFWTTFGRAALGQKATVIITGDARNNYRDPGMDALRAMRERVRRVYWLNPEPRRAWNTTDSIMAVYAPFCDGVFEVRNLRQLTECVRAIV